MITYDYNVPSFSPHVPGFFLRSTSQSNPPLAQGLQELRRTPFVDELGLRDRGSDCFVSAQRGNPNDAPTIWGWCLHIFTNDSTDHKWFVKNVSKPSPHIPE
jgi:hypothetical protein